MRGSRFPILIAQLIDAMCFFFAQVVKWQEGGYHGIRDAEATYARAKDLCSEAPRLDDFDTCCMCRAEGYTAKVVKVTTP